MRPFDGIVDDPKSVPVIVTETLIFGISGLILGVVIDKQFKKLSKKYNKFVVAFFQFLVLSLVIAFSYIYIKGEFSRHFQQTLGGMIFPAMYFGVQSNLFETAQS
jgi:UDP-N-acetylmuramyl pentapeptide phosphotransferase/UDP-N-acetylglucosamine-1-phosphate transferase